MADCSAEGAAFCRRDDSTVLNFDQFPWQRLPSARTRLLNSSSCCGDGSPMAKLPQIASSGTTARAKSRMTMIRKPRREPDEYATCLQHATDGQYISLYPIKNF